MPEPPTEGKTSPQTAGIVIKERAPKRQKSGRRAKESYGTLQKDLVARLEHLQTQAQQICEAYLANLESDISTLADFLDGSSEVRKPKDAKAQTLETWERILDRVQLKTSKGRRKDLRKIDRTVKSMMESAFE